eukprot:2904354-Pyramimonas_sp.AAC.2
MGPYGTLWDLMGPYGTLWCYGRPRAARTGAAAVGHSDGQQRAAQERHAASHRGEPQGEREARERPKYRPRARTFTRGSHSVTPHRIEENLKAREACQRPKVTKSDK